jgi:hypothetical protein
MAVPVPAAALAVAALEREGMRFAGVLAALVLIPAVVLVVGAGVVVAALIPGVPSGTPSSDRMPVAVPPDQMAVMTGVSRETGVPWPLLAAIASVESDFGRNMATSSAGAIGYGQFLPSSWAHWGNGGDPYDYRDAIPAMARYLVDHGAPHDIPRAVYGYNHSWEYVELVLERAAAYAALGPAPRSVALSMEVEVAP